MQITEVRITLAGNNRCGQKDRLRAFATITIDDALVVHDLKVIEGKSGRLFVAMPSRKVSDSCPDCGSKNHLQACYCNTCGSELPEVDSDHLYADICHPINANCRDVISRAVLEEYCVADSAKTIQQ